MVEILSPLSIILAVVSVVCGSLMYYNMRHAIDLKHLRAEIGSMSLLIDSHSASSIVGDNRINIKESIRKLTNSQLSDLKKNLADLRATARQLHCVESFSLLTATRKTSSISAERINYADILLGARVESTECNSIAEQYKFFEWLGVFSNNPQSEQNILSSNMKPGCCFAFKGQEAKITIKLAEVIKIEALELQHISRYDSPSKETSCAPREFSAFAIDPNGLLCNLGDFEYKNLATFQVYPIETENISQKILIYFRSNHGNPNYTCVYRILVYGKPN